MSKTNKLLLMILILIAAFFGINVFKKTNKQSFKINTTNKQEKNLNSQENEGGNVTVTVKPKTLKVGENPSFELEFETHSVDLSFDIVEQSYLVDDNGKRIERAVWDGSPPGGHHRSGTLSFNNSLTQTNFAELIISNVAGVSERKFKWNL